MAPSSGHEFHGRSRQSPSNANWVEGDSGLPELGADRVLQAVLDAARQLVGQGAAVVVLHGPPGIGKFTRADRAAMTLRDELGAVFLELRPGRTPSGAANEFRELLRMLGARALLPLEADAGHLSEDYAKVTERVRTVLLLDDVEDWSQIRPLLPSGPDGLVIATSLERCNDSLGLGSGKVVNIPVQGPGIDDCADVFRDAVRTRASPLRSTIMEIVEQCFRRPLAIQLAGALYARHGQMGGEDLLRELRRRLADQQRLPGSRHRASADLLLEAVLDWAYEDLLDAEHRSLLEVLSLPESSTVGVHTAAVLNERNIGVSGEIEVERVSGLLQDLADRYFLEWQGGDRFRISSAVRGYAAHRLSRSPGGDEVGRNQAGLQLLAAYRRLTSAVQPVLEGQLEPLPPFEDTGSALDWLAEEKGAIIRALQTAERVDPGITLDVVKALSTFFVTTGDLNSLSMLDDVVDKESAGGGLALGENGVLRSVRCAVDMAVGVGARRDGQLEASYEQLRAVREKYAEDNNEVDEAWALRHMGVTLHYMGDFAPAMRYLRRARDKLTLRDQLENEAAQVRKAWVLHGLGALYGDVGAFDKATEVLRESLALHERYRSVRGRSWAQLVLASCHIKGGDDPDGALELLGQAADGFTRTGDQAGLAWVRLETARSRMALGRVEEARRELRDALAVLETEGKGDAGPGTPHVWIDRRALAWTRFEYARCLRHLDDEGARTRELTHAKALFDDIGDRYGAAWTAAEQARNGTLEGGGAGDAGVGAHRVDPVTDSRCYIEASVMGDVPVVREQPYRIRLDVELDQDLVDALEAQSKVAQLRLLVMAPFADVEPSEQELQPVSSQWPLTADVELKSQQTGEQQMRFVLIAAASGTVLQDISCRVEVCQVEAGEDVEQGTGVAQS